MNVNVYINDALADQLDLIAVNTHKKRNTLIQEAISNLVANYRKKKWPEAILNFKGIEGISDWKGFEESRKELLEPKLDIF